MKIDTRVYTRNDIALSDGFNSGNEYLDNFIKSEEALDIGIGKTFIWLNNDGDEIIGYYNIGVGYIDSYDGNDKYKVGGSVHLNFFALNGNYHGVVMETREDGRKIKASDELFMNFMERVYELRDKYIGFSFVTLAATEEGYSLYKRNSFEDLDEDLHFSLKDDEDGCRPMYLALDFE